jgi:hypothetical protein
LNLFTSTNKRRDDKKFADLPEKNGFVRTLPPAWRKPSSHIETPAAANQWIGFRNVKPEKATQLVRNRRDCDCGLAPNLSFL